MTDGAFPYGTIDWGRSKILNAITPLEHTLVAALGEEGTGRSSCWGPGYQFQGAMDAWPLCTRITARAQGEVMVSVPPSPAAKTSCSTIEQTLNIAQQQGKKQEKNPYFTDGEAITHMGIKHVYSISAGAAPAGIGTGATEWFLPGPLMLAKDE